MTRDTTNVLLIAFLAIIGAALLTGGPMMGWGMMGWGAVATGMMTGRMMNGAYLVSPVAAIFTFLLCTLAIVGLVFLVAWLVRELTSPQQPKS
jgi:hypothetical protein